MWQRKFRRLKLIVKVIIGKWWIKIGKYRLIWQRKLIRFLLPTLGIIGILVVIIVVPLNYTPNTSVLFPYIPPPEGPEGYYIATTVDDLLHAYEADYTEPFDLEAHIGQSFIFWDVSISTRGIKTIRTEAFLMSSNIKFVPQDPSELEGLKAGDVVDIIGVCAGLSEEFPIIIVFRNCQVLSRGVAPLPLPGGPAPIAGY